MSLLDLSSSLNLEEGSMLEGPKDWLKTSGYSIRGPGPSANHKANEKKEKSNAEVKRLTGLLAQYDAKIMRLKTALHEASVAPVEKPCLMIVLRQENDAVKAQVGT
ncbi:hypothetical protein HAX54_004507 [Datura stramonium]|uniref:Uncharacterized protein n=1 Tax=Datura stramonium TaxID=4076 RepID=A0ABS8RTU7_DATST|nr:hypothetical protein [Datura stramonium]